MKKIFSLVLALGFLAILLPFNSASAEGELNEDNVGTIDLESIDLGNLKYGETITFEDVEITKHTQKEVNKVFPDRNFKNEGKLAVQSSSCANGATSFRRTLTVKDRSGTVLNYKPTADIWTELCKNNAGQYVVKSIVGVTLNRAYGSNIKAYDGTILTKALNSGKTLFYALDGNWYNNATSTTGTTIGGGTPVFSADITASSTTSFFGYTYQNENIILFR